MSLPRHAQSPSRGQCNGPVLGGKDNANGELRFVPQEILLRVRETDLVKRCTAVRLVDDHDTAMNIQMEYYSEVSRLLGGFPKFELGIVGDLLFRSDEILEMFQAISSGAASFHELSGNSMLYTISPWTKLQFVLAASQHTFDPDLLGLFVGHAWKEGNGQSILTANFEFETCSRWLETSSKRGLNAVDPAPTKPIGKTLFRGGAFCPNLAHGMAWTEDRDMAKFFATRLSAETPIVVSTRSEANKVLVRYKHESEVVLPYDPTREFEVEFV